MPKPTIPVPTHRTLTKESRRLINFLTGMSLLETRFTEFCWCNKHIQTAITLSYFNYFTLGWSGWFCSSRSKVFDIATWRFGDRIPAGASDFSLFSKTSTLTLESTQSHIQWVFRFFPWIRQTGRDVNLSPPSSAKVRNEWCYTSNPPTGLHSVDREKFVPLCWPITVCVLIHNCRKLSHCKLSNK
jgi:hypothetical protein